VKPVRYGLDGSNVDVRRELIVEFSAQGFRRHVGVQLEMRHLRECVHTGVGSTRPIQLELATFRDRSNRAIDFPLDRPRILLDLPSTITGSGVLDQQLESRHGFSLKLLIVG